MSRFAQTEAALLKRLRAMGAAPDMSINLFDIGVLLGASGFTQEEMIGVLDALEQEKFIAYAPGNRLQILKELPEAEC